MNLVSQDLWAGPCKPFPTFPSQWDSQWLCSEDFPEIPVVCDQSKGSCHVTLSAVVGSWLFPLGFLFPLEVPEPQGRPLCMEVCCSGRESMGSTCSCFSYLLMQSVLISEVQEVALDSPPCSRILSVVSYCWVVVSCSCDREQSQEWPISLSWCHSLCFFWCWDCWSLTELITKQSCGGKISTLIIFKVSKIF